MKKLFSISLILVGLSSCAVSNYDGLTQFWIPVADNIVIDYHPNNRNIKGLWITRYCEELDQNKCHRILAFKDLEYYFFYKNYLFLKNSKKQLVYTISRVELPDNSFIQSKIIHADKIKTEIDYSNLRAKYNIPDTINYIKIKWKK